MLKQQGSYRGVIYEVEALPSEDKTCFRGEFMLPQFAEVGRQDTLHPSMDPWWATEREALSYATEAAHHAIEVLLNGRPQGQGRGSPSSQRRTDGPF